MSIRTFRQRGQGYGTVPVNITAKINGSVVYTGEVDTEPAQPPSLPDLTINLGVPIFSWTNPDIAFAGAVYMEITVNNSISDNCFLYLTNTEANYVRFRDNENEWFDYKGPDFYDVCYSQIIEDDQGSWISSDPQTNVVIDGVPVEPHPVRDYPGQYYWRIGAQQTLTCTVNILRGYDNPPEFDINQSYVQKDLVSFDSKVYAAKASTTGNLPTDTVFWRQYGVIS